MKFFTRKRVMNLKTFLSKESNEGYVTIFPNGYGAIILSQVASTERMPSIWKIKVIRSTQSKPFDSNLNPGSCHDIPFTDDMLEYLPQWEVDGILAKISELEPKK